MGNDLDNVLAEIIALPDRITPEAYILSFDQNLNFVYSEHINGHDGKGFKFYNYPPVGGPFIHGDFFLMILSSSIWKYFK